MTVTIMPNSVGKSYKLGWMVVRFDPWEVRGIFDDKDEADRTAKEAGSGYTVRWGMTLNRSDDTTTPAAAPEPSPSTAEQPAATAAGPAAIAA